VQFQISAYGKLNCKLAGPDGGKKSFLNLPILVQAERDFLCIYKGKSLFKISFIISEFGRICGGKRRKPGFSLQVLGFARDVWASSLCKACGLSASIPCVPSWELFSRHDTS
jgi:hypothetical protein